MALPNNPTPAELVKEVKALNTNKMDKANPTGTGALSINRRASTTIGSNSVALGNDNRAEGQYSFAEGGSTRAAGFCSHSEGYQTIANNSSAHAEGNNTSATGSYSHSQGYYTKAQRKSQHVFGEYNTADTGGTGTSDRGTYVEIVGNGTADNARSNARTLDWSGNEKLAGWVTMNGNVEAVGYDLTGTSTAEQTLLDNYYTKSQSNNNFVNITGYDRLGDINQVVLANKTFWYDNTTTNQPNSETNWGTVVYNYGNNSNWVNQLVFPNEADWFYKRQYVNGSWKPWKQYFTNPANVEQLFTSQISANTNVSLNGSITNYRYIIIGGCDQSNGGKSHVMLPTKLFTTNIDSAINNGWNRLVVTTSEGYVGLWYVGETNGNSVFHIDGFSGSPSFNWLLVYGVK